MNRVAELDFEQAINQLLLECGYTIATRLPVQGKAAELVETLRVLTSIASCVRQFAQARRARMVSDGQPGQLVDRTTLAAVRAVFEDLVDSQTDQGESELPSPAAAQQQNSPKEEYQPVIAGLIPEPSVTGDCVTSERDTDQQPVRPSSYRSTESIRGTCGLDEIVICPIGERHASSTDSPASTDYRKPDYQEPDYQEPDCQEPNCQEPNCPKVRESP